MTSNQHNPYPVTTQSDWGKLKRRVQYQRNQWKDAGTNKDDRVIAAGMSAAFGMVLQMMRDLERKAQK